MGMGQLRALVAQVATAALAASSPRPDPAVAAPSAWCEAHRTTSRRRATVEMDSSLKREAFWLPDESRHGLDDLVPRYGMAAFEPIKPHIVAGFREQGLERSRGLRRYGAVGLSVAEPHPQLGVQPEPSPEPLPEAGPRAAAGSPGQATSRRTLASDHRAGGPTWIGGAPPALPTR